MTYNDPSQTRSTPIYIKPTVNNRVVLSSKTFLITLNESEIRDKLDEWSYKLGIIDTELKAKLDNMKPNRSEVVLANKEYMPGLFGNRKNERLREKRKVE
jgi:hypothetical protein